MRNVTQIILVGFLAFASADCTKDAGPDTQQGGSAPPAGAPAPAAPASEPLYRVPVDEDLPSIGDPRAPVTVVAFIDYECPFCRRAEKTLEKVRESYGNDVRIVAVEHPLPMHDRARPAALAAIAAGMQGRFEEMHTRLFKGPLDEAAIEAAAHDVGLDVARFDADRNGEAASRALDHGSELASKVGVTGTPTFFVNGRRIAGAQPENIFRSVIDERLSAARALLRTGVRPSRVYEETVAAGLPSVAADGEEHGHACSDPGCDGKGEPPAVGAKVESVPTAGDPARGPASASITVVVFSDYQCPFCRRAEPIVHALEQAHPGDVRVVFKNMPLPMHDNARLAAKAAVAADQQGRFWEYHDALFAHQTALDRDSLVRYATDLGLDARRFSHDLDDPSLDARIDADVSDADALGVKGTPTLFVNGHRVVGAQPITTLEAAAARD
jgi:protein-disulfide isomerase